MRRVRVRIETARFGFVKRRDDGSVDFVSPLPTPFHYGSVPGTIAGDGDRLDAIVLGHERHPTPIAPGTELDVSVYGEVRFVDAGAVDTKLVTSDGPPTEAERRLVVAFFRVYVHAKRLLHALRGERGETRFDGVSWEAP